MFIKVTYFEDDKRLINLNDISEIREEDGRAVFVWSDGSRSIFEESFQEVEAMITKLQKR